MPEAPITLAMVLAGVFLFVQNPIELSVPPAGITLFHEKEGLTAIVPDVPENDPFQESKIVDWFVFRLTIQFVVG